MGWGKFCGGGGWGGGGLGKKEKKRTKLITDPKGTPGLKVATSRNQITLEAVDSFFK